MPDFDRVVSIPDLEKLIGKLVANIRVPDERLVQRFESKLALLNRGMGFVVVLPTCHQDAPKPEEAPSGTMAEEAERVARRAAQVATEAKEVAEQAQTIAKEAQDFARRASAEGSEGAE
jgi:hypothetical protein